MTVPRISPSEAQEKMEREGYVYVDVRTEEEFRAGHPAGAVNVPFMLASDDGMRPNPDFLSAMRERFGREARLILGCRSGVRSLRAAQALAADGFDHVTDQRAGWDGRRDPFGQLVEAGWSKAGLPVSATA